jgi:tripartite-type tricarboxylate transporter receptor subunit TctC
MSARANVKIEGSSKEDEMPLPRRRFLQLAASVAAFPVISPPAWPQSYPAPPVRIVVGIAAGSSPDIAGRLIAQSLSERLGQSFIIENRPGGGGNVATESVLRAPPDGYTLLLVSGTNAINATLYKSSFDFVRDVSPVGSISTAPNVMVVHPSLEVQTVAQFIAYAKANPGKINMASAGNGSQPHVAGELFKMMAGVDMVHVPYRGGGPALTDLIGGQVQVMFPTTASSIEHIRSGKLRALGVTTSTRLEVLPAIPTISDTVAGYEASSWFGVAAPRNTPAEIIGRLNSEINAALADPKIKARLADLGNTGLPGSPADFGKLLVDEVHKWAKVIRFAGIKPE